MKIEWNADLYDDKHKFVSKYGEGLIDLLNAKDGEFILDIGCGTGDLAMQIANTGAKVKGVDASNEMIKQAKVKYPNIYFQVMDVTKLEEIEMYDAVFSNAALHWVKEMRVAVEKMYQVLKVDGRFVAEFGGAGNIVTIVETIKATMEELQLEYQEDQFPWIFPTTKVYRKLLEEAGFIVKLIEIYDRPTDLEGDDGIFNWLQMFSHSIFSHLTKAEKRKVYEETERKLKSKLYHNGKWVVDYRRLRVVAYK